MPCISIEVRKEYNKEEGLQIINAVHSALQSAFKILATDRVVRLIVHSPDRFACPIGLEKPDRYTLITIDAYMGRSAEAKRELYKSIAENLEPLGIPGNHMLILLREFSSENWGIDGGKMASEAQLEYKIDI